MIRNGRKQLQKTRGGVFHILLFVIASVGITATATIAIYKAYEEYVVKPRMPTELQRLREQVRQLEQETENLKNQKEALSEHLRNLPHWKESNTFREYLVERTIALGEALERQAVRQAHIASGTATHIDKMMARAPSAPVAVTLREQRDRQFEYRVAQLPRAIQIIEQSSNELIGSLPDFDNREAELLKEEVARSKNILVEHQAEMSMRADQRLIKDAAAKARRR